MHGHLELLMCRLDDQGQIEVDLTPKKVLCEKLLGVPIAGVSQPEPQNELFTTMSKNRRSK